MPPAFPKPETKPSLGHGLNLHSMRKAASCEPLGMDNLASSDDESYRGDDDVFTDGSNDGFHTAPNPHEAKEVAVYQDSGDRADPQTMYAGSSCMFVANLPQHYSDRKLEEEVTKAFSQFGIVFVKIKRDGRGMPFAFCQYTVSTNMDNSTPPRHNADTRLERRRRPECHDDGQGHGDSRETLPYRNGEGAYSGQRIRLSEARDLLRRLGEVAKSEYLNEGLRVIGRLPQAVIVTYKMYDPRRDPPRTFENDPTFCVKVYDPKALSGQGSASNANPREGGFLKQYDRDRRSAYVGNLPPGMTKDVLKSLGSSCGEVLDVQLHLKEVAGGNGQKTCFAFLEFNRPDAPDELIEAMHNTEIDKYRIRVERKQSRPIETPRRALPQAGDTPHERFSVRRPRVGSFELEKPSDGRFGTPPGSGRQPRRALYASNSFTPGRSRYSRPSILGSGASPTGSIFEPVTPAFATTPYGFVGPSQTGSAAAAAAGPSAKKSVDFDLSHRSESGSSANSESGPENADATSKPTTPKVNGMSATSSTKKASASRKVEAPPAPHTAMPWMPPYPHFGYPYMGAPMTPQTNPAFMYPGYMQPPMYHPMYDMYGNMMMSPTHMMPTFGAAPVSNETPAHSDYDDKASDGSNEEKPDKDNSKGKGRAS
ncbi:Meiotic activator RIM4 [Tolypocladium paradoxum]|uniref:Meiotic activator RIM4 n=1 Tax=Tolypocladium paradoxum TaxID=94208 RepID=A0A2S4KRV3_9HYPO|nr:Meiotic activator RIM4 [Tolypocladium paradoxum]